ncbi:MAG: LysM peptidoglycan-binding domain-containing protein [Lachnospiraceae bacterium]|nr:LysM peptidoglycan-binding domain-containing protein [Lachnospiraceae bacterium]
MKIRKTIILAVVFVMTNIIPVSAASPYEHDPMANPSAAADIVVDPSAVYGYAPSPESKRLKDYVEYDWSDPSLVAEMRQQREDYHDSMKELYSMITTMKTAGASTKDIAIAVSTRRNELRLLAYKGDPKGLAKVKKSNLENYGNENGGTPEFFYKKYGSWETVIEKALSTNAGADACLGLYDKYYDTYFISSGSSKVSGSNQKNATTNSTYTVVQGDTLSTIAAKTLGDKAAWKTIYDLNKDTIKDPNRIYIGQVIRVE